MGLDCLRSNEAELVEGRLLVRQGHGCRFSPRRVVYGGMYVGPKGEYYAGLPVNEQLRQVYGF